MSIRNVCAMRDMMKSIPSAPNTTHVALPNRPRIHPNAITESEMIILFLIIFFELRQLSSN